MFIKKLIDVAILYTQVNYCSSTNPRTENKYSQGLMNSEGQIENLTKPMTGLYIDTEE